MVDIKFISREEALRKGLTRYYTGKPCKNGHLSERQTSKHTCIECKNDWKKSNSDKVKNYNSKRYRDKSEHIKLVNSEWLKNNKDKKNKIDSRYRSENREITNKKCSDWKKTNIDKVNFYASKRRSGKRTPLWANLETIKKMYEERNRLTKITGLPHHVDHIIPLFGKYVCGLHVENNMRIVLASENLLKNRKHESDSYWS